MSYATLMVYVDVDDIPEQRVRIASELAAKFDAALIGFSAHAVPPPFFAEDAIKELTTEADIKKMHKALAKRGDWFRSIVGTDRQDIEWRTTLDLPCDALAREASCADLQHSRVQSRELHPKTLASAKALIQSLCRDDRSRPIAWRPSGFHINVFGSSQRIAISPTTWCYADRTQEHQEIAVCLSP